MAGMNWPAHFARRTACLKPSAIRELLKVGARPGVVSLAGGLPAPELFPVEKIEAATQAVLREHGRKALQYGETEGLAALRDWIAAKYSVGRENVLVTTGAQQGIDLLGRIFLENGDKVVVENPTYLAALSAWRPLGVKFLAAPTDDRGMRTDQLGPLLEEGPKFLYVQPNFQNPTGVTMTAERRHELLEMVKNVPIIEDDPYGELWFDAPHPESLFGRGENVVHLGTFSKILAPALRVGWTVGPAELIDKMTLAKQAADLQSSTFNQFIVLEMINGGLDLQKLRDAYQLRRDAMLEALEKHFPSEAHWTRPDGGLFVWVTLPENLNAMSILPRAVENDVTFVPGEDFFVDGTGQNTMRLNFSNPSIESINAGVARLGAVLKTALSA